MSTDNPLKPYRNPAGGWGSVKAVAGILIQEHVALHGSAILSHQNKPDGFACVSCSWAKPADPHLFEFCENGAKATAWEITSKHIDADFFAQHTLTDLESWSGLELESAGRLITPMRWDAVTDRYVPTTWQDAFDGIANELQAIDPNEAVFYASGRASLETSYLYQLLARMYGTNNLPDSSNMCHESTSVALPQTIGSPVGTVTLDDFEHTDCMFFFGHNTGTNAPRMLHQLQDARKRGVQIITFNPIKERGLVSFANPQSPLEMLTPAQTQISTQYHQLRIGGDEAAIAGMCKLLIEWDDAAQRDGTPRVLDAAFIAEHTEGFDRFAAAMRATTWAEIERRSQLTRDALGAAATEYARAKSVMVLYGMGITQHRNGVQNVQMLSNLLLLRGNIGKPGAGICPIRGHSNVQGQRTVGITEKPELAPLDTLKELYGFEPPRNKGMSTVEACQGVLDGKVKAFIGLGGNFQVAIPDHQVMDPAWRSLRLTVQIATKLNRSHLLHGKVAYLLPCLGRIEVDRQASGEQWVSVEDSTACVHGSHGYAQPASELLLSEPAIVAGIAKALLPDNPLVNWDAWVADYATIRDAIEQTYPDQFGDFNSRFRQPGGFHRPIPAAERKWKTPNGKANFVVPDTLDEDADMPSVGPDVLSLMTTRGDSQFNTTVYTLDDRFRGVHGTRDVLLMHRDDMARLGFAEGEEVHIATVSTDEVGRELGGMHVHAFDIPPGCIMGYYPECNRLIPLSHHAKDSLVPASKSIPVRLRPASVPRRPASTVI
ncbi:FdhF/YdeP family oxidoreductase [Paraburkholderia bryophila]|jgi:molybdopterin-dependent oxidoreductase alpha subunit|uniref:Molybdopterin-dependent oxidoreductase alpha subunit n=1 Tax=Paraburkholderia bryophila TaxID=420952 RepID=A0A329BIG8_9BURK|nr:FdhF/YdeP family oxidoreductase [Paraburkholderia bryophila]RAS22089.1 molybdopterin-dependent oxidoreductase alpha subunit [Paraburkholderia bryophila]